MTYDMNPPDSLDHGDQMLAELCRGGERHEDLVLPAVGRDLGDLDEPAARVLLHVEVEPLALQDEGARGQVAGAASSPAPVATAAPVLGTGLRPRHVDAQSPLPSASRGDGGEVPKFKLQVRGGIYKLINRVGHLVMSYFLLTWFDSKVLALKHESRILGQWSNPVCGSWKSQASSPWA